MIVCPNCSHANPDGATNCEACYTALPATKACLNCGASVQLDATFCGQCGHNFQIISNPSSSSSIPANPPENQASEVPNLGLPPTVLTSNEAPTVVITQPPVVEPAAAVVTPVEPETLPPIPDPDLPASMGSVPTSPPIIPAPGSAIIDPGSIPTVIATPVATQLQQSSYHLLHLQTNTPLEIPPHLSVVYLGKPNDISAPDIDVSGFSCAEVVSRVHANILVEGENYYIEDLGSANGTYINHNTLIKGNRHLLRSGDRISLGKGDLVTFIFQTGSV